MLRLVDNALELWMVPCESGHCLYARRGPSAELRSERSSAPLALKLRMIKSAHARPGERFPQRCGKHCLGLLQKDLLNWIPADPAQKVGQQAELAAAVLCFHLLRLNEWLQQPSARAESTGLLFRMRSWKRAWNFFQVLWHATVLLPWTWLLQSSWPVFSLLRHIKSEWPNKGNWTCGSTNALQQGLEQVEQLMSSGDGFVVPGFTEDYECGWVEGLTRRLLVAREIYKQNSFAYRMWNPRRRSFDLLPQVEGFVTVLEGLRVDAMKITFKGGALPKLLGSQWDFCDVLASLENLFLFRSLGLQEQVLPPAPVIVEGGANDGIHVAQFMDHWPEAKVLAFEADKTCFAHLVRNLGPRIKQRSHRSRLYGVALAGQMGVREMFLRDGNHTSAVNMLFEPTDQYGEHYSHVKWREETQFVVSVTLDSLQNDGVDRVDFLELDIQCAEFEVLNSSTEILPTVTMVVLESCLPPGMCKDAPKWPELHAMLRKKGFELLVAANDPLEEPDMCFDAVYVNLALEPTAALAALDVALELDGD